MSTIEKLFVQLFDQKRQIIEELNHQKQLYDKYLLSRLLILCIPPPPWLLNFNSQSATSHFTDVQASSSCHGEEVGGFNLPEIEAEVNMLPDFNFNHAVDGSWPGYSRRKIQCQNLNKSASPTFRANPFHAINEKIPSRSAHTEKANIPPAFEHSTNSHNSEAALSDCVLAAENDWSVTSLSKEHVSTPQVQYNKYKVCSGRTVVASTCELLQLSKPDVSNERRSIVAEPSDSLPEDGEVKKNLPLLISGMASDGLVNGQVMVDGNTVAKLMYTEGAVNQTKSPQRIDGSKLSIGSPQTERMNVTEVDQTIPEFEGFIIGDNPVDAQSSQNELVQKEVPFLSSVMDNASLPKQICKSPSLSTPVSPFPTACKFYLAPGVYSSAPNGLLENNDLRSNLLTSGSALLGKSHSDLFSFPGSQYGWDNKKLFFSPVGKGFEGITSKSGGSDKLRNSNLELTCFPILEDPESAEEDVDDVVNLCVKRSESSAKVVAKKGLLLDIIMQRENSLAPEDVVARVGLESMSTEVRRYDSSTRRSGNKEPLCDITMQNESTLALDHAIERCSQGSVGTNSSIHEINDNKKSSMCQRRNRQTRPGKENKDFSVVATIADSNKKPSKSLSSRFSKPKLSGQSCLRSRGQSVLKKGQKRNDTVSGVKSFVPLVQQKQAAAAVLKKKDVKVKALQAAEAAKRAADMRENERKQKKAAMKLERAREEQERMKELELRKKLKEDQRKKREAENAAKKRQREEEEMKEKERKKRRIEEARLQQKQAEVKLHAGKEGLRCAAENERAHQEKDTNEKTENQIGKGTEGNSEKPMNDSAVVRNDQRETNAGKMGNIDVAESSTPSFDKIDKPINQISHSYDLSPYWDSDDEEEKEDEIPNRKFVPSWASKTCVMSALSSSQRFDPDMIFPRGSFCSMEEVLFPRRLLQK